MHILGNGECPRQLLSFRTYANILSYSQDPTWKETYDKRFEYGGVTYQNPELYVLDSGGFFRWNPEQSGYVAESEVEVFAEQTTQTERLEAYSLSRATPAP